MYALQVTPSDKRQLAIGRVKDQHYASSVYDRILFYLLGQILMLFSYESEKRPPYEFSSLRLGRIKVSNFTSGLVQYRAKRETGDGRTVTSIQERLCLPVSY